MARTRARTVGYIITGVLVVAAVLAGAVYFTGRPAFCGSCHEMATVHASWRYSTHADVADCLDCHAKPGLGNEILAHLNGARYVWVKITGVREGEVFRAEIDNSSCLRCHPATELVSLPTEQSARHGLHSDRDVDCDDCHDNLVHRTFRAIVIKPQISTCIECHEREGITVDADKLATVTQQ